ncbi:PH domain-containing protein [Cardiobacteriaceae bacterium TAE3-ERU3]|nr:PH domain-containing protein [Cardiobacteriaceae bacterium TAE3-ERU3]
MPTHSLDFQALPKAALMQIRIALLPVVLLVPVLLTALYWLIALIFYHLPDLLRNTLLVALTQLVIFVALWIGLSKLRYRYTTYELNAHVFAVRTGIFWRNDTRVTRARVQYVDIQRSPLARRLGLATLTVFTSGSALPAIKLAGLSLESAEEIRYTLIERDRA